MNSIRASNIEYQPFLLKKKLELRTYNNKSYPLLKKALGLLPVPPEKSITGTIFSSLLPKKKLNTHDNSSKYLSSCEILILISIDIETSNNFNKTILGVNQNLEYFAKSGLNTDQIACVVIVDGISNFQQIYNSEPDFYKEYFLEDEIKKYFGVDSIEECKIPDQKKRDEFIHCFAQKRTHGNCTMPLNIMFCVKHIQKRKLNTHLWFFGGFCFEMQPNFVFLLDAETRPLRGSLFKLYDAMYSDPRVAGCCGEIRPMNLSLRHIVVPAQVFEYKIMHMFDKAAESVVGFVSVLPGNFSGYRWNALWDGCDEDNPSSIKGSPLWDDYFKSICYPEDMSAHKSNIYLAEDRVLSMSLITKKGKGYILRYVKESIAETTIPDSIAILMAQRRRWINGSWFTLLNSLKKISRIINSNQCCLRKLWFLIHIIFSLLKLLFSWFIVSIYMLLINLAITYEFSNYTDDPELTEIPFSEIYQVLKLIYIATLSILIILSLAVKPKRVERTFKVIALILSAYQSYSIYVLIKYILYHVSISTNMIFALLLISFGIGLVILLNCEIHKTLFGIFHYIILFPTYINVFTIYSICNINDCTWGNRPDNLTVKEKSRLENFEDLRAKCVFLWLFANFSFYYCMVVFLVPLINNSSYFFLIVFAGGFVIIMAKILGALLYMCEEKCRKKIKGKVKIADREVQERNINAAKLKKNLEVFLESNMDYKTVSKTSETYEGKKDADLDSNSSDDSFKKRKNKKNNKVIPEIKELGGSVEYVERELNVESPKVFHKIKKTNISISKVCDENSIN